MTDTILTIAQVEDLFRALTLDMLGLDPAAAENNGRVRISWPTKGAPAWKIDEDVTFLLINYDDDLITRQTEVTYQPVDADNANRSAAYTRVLRVNWVFYGPHSFDDADTVRAGFFTPSVKETLDKNHLALILDVPVPVRSPELFNGQWWERTSLYARFNELVVRNSSVPYIKTADFEIKQG